MKNKINLFFIFALVILLAIAAIFWIYSSTQSLTIGNVETGLNSEGGTVFIKLPSGSSTTQKIFFVLPFKNNNIYIKKLSSGPDIIEDPEEEKLENGKEYDFGQFISHCKLIIKQGTDDIEYDLWITTGDVPILMLDVDGDIPNEPKVSAVIQVFSETGFDNMFPIPAEIEQVDTDESIPKDSYSLNITENIITGVVPSILDFEDSKRFTLTSSCLDSSFLRQKISYDIFSSLSKDNISSETRYVELFLNGNYNGLYLLSRRPDRNMFSLSNFNEDDAIHSVLYEAVNWRADFTRGIEGFSQVEPDYEGDLVYFGPLEELISFITETTKDEFLDKIDEVIDMDCLIDNHLLFLLTGSTNELSSNQYIYRSNTSNSKFKFSPGDHYISSFVSEDGSSRSDAEVINYGTRLYNRLYEDPEYRKKLENRWNDLREEIITTDNIYRIIDKNVSLIYESQARNLTKWPIIQDAYEDSFDYSLEIDYIKEFVDRRITYLDDYMSFPPLLQIGDSYARIDEQNNIIFCSLPVGSDTVQKINWHFSESTKFYLKAFSYGEIGVYKDDNSKYLEIVEIFEKGDKTEKALFFMDSPKIDIDHPELAERITLKGQVLDLQDIRDMDIERVFVFDSPLINKKAFLGEAAYNESSGFELNINTLLVENGIHDLYIYALYEDGDYSFQEFRIEIKNRHNEVEEIREPQIIKLKNGESFDFENFIFHGSLTIENNENIEIYDLWVTTGDTPLGVIDTDGEIINNEYRINGKINVMYHDPDEKNFINSNIFDFSGDLGIKIRGQSSQDFPKKQYSIELIDDNGEELNVSLLGLPEESDWVLRAPYGDKTLIRNIFAFELSNQMGLYAPRTKILELFINESENLIIEGGYNGVYVLTERIKRDKDRINIERLEPDDLDISGGYILEWDPLVRLKEDESYFFSDRGIIFINKYPNENTITPEQKEWITDYINEFESVLYGDNFLDINEGYKKYINFDSFIDYILINEFLQNKDVFWAGTYLYKDKGGKLNMGPIWDFDSSSGNNIHREFSPYVEFRGFGYIERQWTEMLFKDSYFTSKYIARWKELRESIFSDDNINSIIEKSVDGLSDASERNFDKWEILGKYVYPNPEPYANTYEEEIEKLRTWFSLRTDWIDNNIDSLIDYWD